MGIRANIEKDINLGRWFFNMRYYFYNFKGEGQKLISDMIIVFWAIWIY